MGDTKAKSTQGVEFQIGDQETVEGFDTIAEVTNFQAPGIVVNEIEVTALDHDFVQRIGGIKDGDSATLDMNYIFDDVAQQRLRARAGLKTNFRIELNDATTPTRIAFAAIPTAVPGPSGGVNEAQKVNSVNLRVTGAVTVTPGTP